MDKAEEFPILEYAQQIVNGVAKNKAIAISLPTGSGKSTMLPMILNKLKVTTDAGEKSPKIVVTVPTVVTAKSLHQVVSSMSGLKVGYAADGETLNYPGADISYVTSGYLSKVILTSFRTNSKNHFRSIDYLILDEFHTKTLANTIILNAWRYCNNSNLNVPRLIVSSATLNVSAIDWISEKVIVELEPKYPVELVYGGHTYTAGDLKVLDDLNHKILEYHKANKYEGSFLVFVPGMYEIDTLCKKLESQSDIKALRVHSEISDEELSLINKEFEGQRKVIVATNIVEAAITIKGLSGVFDSMMERQAITSDVGAIEMVTILTSKSSATQRKGRIGRLGPGFCYRAIKMEDYEGLNESPSPEISRIPIERELLDLQEGKLPPSFILEEPGYDGLDKKISDTTAVLMYLNMLTQGNVMPKGQFASKVPLAVRNSSFLYDWIVMGHDPYPGIILASVIDNFSPSFMRISRDQRPQEFRDRNRDIIGPSDLHTLMLVMARSEAVCGGWKRVRNRNLSDFASNHNVSSSRIVDTFKRVSKVILALGNSSILRSGPINVPESSRIPNDIGAFIDAIVPLVFEAYGDRKSLYHTAEGVNTVYRLANSALPIYVNNSTKISLPLATPTEIYPISYRLDRSGKYYQCLLSADNSRGNTTVFAQPRSHSVGRPKERRETSLPRVPKATEDIAQSPRVPKATQSIRSKTPVRTQEVGDRRGRTTSRGPPTIQQRPKSKGPVETQQRSKSIAKTRMSRIIPNPKADNSALSKMMEDL